MRRGMGKHPVSVLLDLLFPPRCAFCGRLVEEGDVCAACAEALGVRALKFGKKSWRARVFARYIAQTAAEELSGGFDAVSFVPVSLRRNFERGFDQARLLAEEAANIWGVKAEAVLRKDRHTRAQSSLQDAALRKTNVKGAYRVPHPERVRGRRFLLIDDVCTTGSTLSAAADALLEAGAAGVVCAVLAGGSRKRENSEELFP